MSASSKVLESPQSTIGAQELIAVGHCTKTGFLRKEGRIERMFKFMKWRQRFVALSRGCIYIFDDELAPSPKAAYSLRFFVKCERNHLNEVINPFRVISVNGNSGKSLQFSCMSDPDRKGWMQHIRQEMLLAHKLPQSVIDEDDGNFDDYVYLEKPIPRRAPPPPPSSSQRNDCDLDEEDDDDPGGEAEYTTIDDEMMEDIAAKKKLAQTNAVPMAYRTPLTLPANGKKKPAANGKKSSHTLPDKQRSVVSREAFEYDGSDRSEIERLLVVRPEGTYLVRKSRSDGREVLSVNIEGTLKEFKIYTKDDQVTINNEDYFSSVEELIQNYRDHTLPKKSTKLCQAYSVTDPRYKNEQ